LSELVLLLLVLLVLFTVGVLFCYFALPQARIIMSGAGDWRYVDVVHRLAGKLEALEWVRQVYGVPVEVRHRASLGQQWDG
jgi:hypothetical protein